MTMDGGTRLPPGVWWKAPLLLGTALWFGLPLFLLGLQISTAALYAAVPALPGVRSLMLVLHLLGQILAIGVIAFSPVLLPAIAFAAWLLRAGRLSWPTWSLGPPLFAASLGAGLAALADRLNGPLAEDGIVTVFAGCFAVAGLAYGIAFRGLLGLWLRRRDPPAGH